MNVVTPLSIFDDSTTGQYITETGKNFDGCIRLANLPDQYIGIKVWINTSTPSNASWLQLSEITDDTEIGENQYKINYTGTYTGACIYLNSKWNGYQTKVEMYSKGAIKISAQNIVFVDENGQVDLNNTLDDYLKQAISFKEATKVENINSGESLSTILGKIKKWYTDKISKLGTLAFKNSLSRTDEIGNEIITEPKLAPELIQSIYRAENIEYNIDLNTLKTSGVFGVACNSDDSTDLHYPPNESSGVLSVMPAYYGLTQIFVTYGWPNNLNDKFYIRTLYNNCGNWSVHCDWIKFEAFGDGRVTMPKLSPELKTTITNKVDKILGKGLSTNDYTTAEKTKLSQIAPNAQVNSVNTVAGKIGHVVLSKSDVGLTNVDNTSDLSKPISTATQTALNNKVDKISGKGLSTNDYTTSEKTKLTGISAGANNYIHPATHNGSIIQDGTITKSKFASELTDSWFLCGTSKYDVNLNTLLQEGSYGVACSNSTTYNYPNGETGGNLLVVNAFDGTNQIFSSYDDENGSTIYSRTIGGYSGSVPSPWIKVNNSSNTSTSTFFYGICSTSSSTTNKTVSIPDFTLSTGVSVKIKFSVSNTASSTTLNINNTGAKQIYYNNAPATKQNTWIANEIIEFIYDGTYWRSIASSRDQFFYCSNQTELDNAIQALPSAGGKIILGEGYYSLSGGSVEYDSNGDYYYYVAGKVGSKSIKFVGMRNQTTLRVYGRFSGDSYSDYPTEKYYNTLDFEDMNVTMYDWASGKYTNFNFDNCTVNDGGSPGDEMLHCQNSNICNCDIVITSPAIEIDGCYTGFNVSKNIIIDSCNIDLRCPTSITDYSGIDFNLIYNAASGAISNSYIKCGGNTRTNIVNNGNVSMSNNTIILENDKATIAHYSDNTSPTASFVGNYVEYYNTYMRFATISGNTFNHKAVGTSSSNRILLLSSANITGNTFVGSSTTIDCQQHKSIVSLNMSKNGLTVYNAPTGSVNVNNITY